MKQHASTTTQLKLCQTRPKKERKFSQLYSLMDLSLVISLNVPAEKHGGATAENVDPGPLLLHQRRAPPGEPAPGLLRSGQQAHLLA